jgi:hypothetical protein
MQEKLERDKRSSLFSKSVNYGCKTFYNIGSRWHLLVANVSNLKLSFQPIVDKKKNLGQKIDWHDWEAVGADLRRQGPGPKTIKLFFHRH